MTIETTPPAVALEPQPAQSQFPDATAVLQQAISERAFPGCCFGVLAQDQILAPQALGTFTYDRGSPAVQPSTVFDIASITKVVATTAAVMLLNQRGALDLDTPLGELLPGFIVGREPGSFARHIKVRHLLAHNSGLPGYVDFFRQHHSHLGLMRACLELRIQTAPGSRFEYSDPGFILLGKALEVLTGEPLGVFVDREIFRPLGMTSTNYHPAASQRPLIPPTEDDTTFRQRVIQGEVQDENAFVLNGCAGHAGLFSNVRDLLLFSSEVLAAGGGKGRIFEPDTLRYFAERQVPEGTSRALGWDTPSENSSSGKHFSANSIGHLGYSGCSLWIDLDAHIAIVLLTNRTWPDRASDLIRLVRPAFHDAIREALHVILPSRLTE